MIFFFSKLKVVKNESINRVTMKRNLFLWSIFHDAGIHAYIARLCWKGQRQAQLSAPSPLSPPKWSWRWFITTQTNGVEERRKRKAFQAGRGISGHHISWSFHQSPSPASHLNPPLKQSQQTGPVTSPTPSTETGTGGPPSIGYSPETHPVMRKPDRVHYKEVDYMVYELYLNKAIIWKRRRRRRRKEARKGGRKRGREGAREGRGGQIPRN